MRNREPTASWFPAAVAGPMKRVTALPGTGSAPETWLTVTALPRSERGVLVLRVVGEVDLATVGRLREGLHTYVLGTHPGVVLDCTGVSFLGACGISLLLHITAQARDQGVTLRLVTHHHGVLRALEVTGVNRLVRRAATVAEAIVQCST
jgi:anti-anti-sigma factor